MNRSRLGRAMIVLAGLGSVSCKWIVGSGECRVEAEARGGQANLAERNLSLGSPAEPTTSAECEQQYQRVRVASATAARSGETRDYLRTLARLGAIAQRIEHTPGGAAQALAQCRARFLDEVGSARETRRRGRSCCRVCPHGPIQAAAGPCAPRLRRAPDSSPAMETDGGGLAYADVLWMLAEDGPSKQRHALWKDAAVEYGKVVERGGRPAPDAAYAAILAWQQFFDIEELGAFPHPSRIPKRFCKDDRKPCPIPEDQKRMVAAFDAYLALVPDAPPDAPNAAKIKYSSARVLYENHRFEEALGPLSELVDRHAPDYETIYAAFLYLDCLNALQRHQELTATVDRYLADPILMGDRECRPMLLRVRSDIFHSDAKQYDAKGEYLACARSFLAAAKLRPLGSELAASLFNAGLCFHRARRPDKAVETWLDLLAKRPRGLLPERALLSILAEYRPFLVALVDNDALDFAPPGAEPP
jgi:hypothetical protein